MINFDNNQLEFIEPHHVITSQGAHILHQNNSKQTLNSQTDQIRNQLFKWIENLNQSYSQFISDLSDFQNGIILCDLIDLIIYDRQNNDLISSIIFEEKMTYKNCIFNLNIALQSIRDGVRQKDPAIENLTAESIYHNEENIIQILLFLRQSQIKNNSNIIRQNLIHTPGKSNQQFINMVSPDFKQNTSEVRSQKPPLMPHINSLQQLQKISPIRQPEQMQKSRSQQSLKASCETLPNSGPFKSQQIKQTVQKSKNSQSSQQQFMNKQKLFDIKHSPLVEEISQINFETTPRYSQIFNNTLKLDSSPTSARIMQLTSELSQLDQYIQHESVDQKIDLTQEQMKNRSLPKRRPEVNIIKVTDSVVQGALTWLQTIDLIQTNIPNIEEKLPLICKNGVIFFDLINRMEGKENVLKGIQRQPKNNSQVNANFNKIMDYFHQKPKMNPRYLWAQQQLIQGNFDVFWGFLDDIKCFFQNKQSPNDQRNEQKGGNRRNISNNNSLLIITKNEGKDIKQTEKVRPASKDSKNNAEKQSPKNFIQSDEKFNEAGVKNLTQKSSYKQLHKFRQNNHQIQKSQKQSQSTQACNQEITLDMEQKNIQQWMRDIGLGAYINLKDVALFDDPYRNGTILQLICEKVKFLDPQKPLRIKNMDQCKENLRKILIILEKNYKLLKIPPFLFQEENFLRGDPNTIWGMIYYLMLAYKNKNIDRPLELPEINSSINTILPIQMVQNIVLPYNQTQIQDLEASIIKFLKIFHLIDVSIQKQLLISQFDFQIKFTFIYNNVGLRRHYLNFYITIQFFNFSKLV